MLLVGLPAIETLLHVAVVTSNIAATFTTPLPRYVTHVPRNPAPPARWSRKSRTGRGNAPLARFAGKMGRKTVKKISTSETSFFLYAGVIVVFTCLVHTSK